MCATALDVRRMLGELRAHLAAENLPDDDCSNIEIALAEALNNIVEHAYRPGPHGTITLTLSVGPRRLTANCGTRARRMPGLAPPGGTRPTLPASARPFPRAALAGRSFAH